MAGNTPFTPLNERRQSVVDADPEYGELARLYKEDSKSYALRIDRMDLDSAQKDMVAYLIHKEHDYTREGRRWHDLGDTLYAIQITSSAVVPVLIGILGSFDHDGVDLYIRVVAIILSVASTVCAAIESVYSFRVRGQVRVGYAAEINDLFQSFESLSGPLFDHDGYGGHHDKTEAVEEPKAASYTIPDLSAVPRGVLRAHLDHLEETDKEKKPKAEPPRPQEPTHRDFFKAFSCEALKILAEARKASFVGQDSGGGGKMSKGEDAGPSTARKKRASKEGSALEA